MAPQWLKHDDVCTTVHQLQLCAMIDAGMLQPACIVYYRCIDVP